MAVSTLINGNRPSFASLRVTLAGKRPPRGSFASIDYGSSQTPGEIYSKSRSELVGSTPGYVKAQASFEMLVSELNQFLSDLTDDGKETITSPSFDIYVSYNSDVIDTQNDKLVGCRIDTVESSNRAGLEAATKKVTLQVKQVIIAGRVVAGDNARSGTSQDRQPVTSDFWYAPVFEDDAGDWEAPGFVGNTYAKDPWDSVFIQIPFSGTEQPMTPGICEVKLTKYRDVDKNKKAAGSDGKRTTIHGIEPAEGMIELTIWTPQQWRMLKEMWPVLFPGPQKFTTTKTVPVGSIVTSTQFFGSGTATSQGATIEGQTLTIPQTRQTKRVSTTQVKSIIRPFDVRHPEFDLHDIKSVVFVRAGEMSPGPAPFSKVFTMHWVEFMPPNNKINATTTPAAAKASTLEPLGYQTPGSNPQNGNLV